MLYRYLLRLNASLKVSEVNFFYNFVTDPDIFICQVDWHIFAVFLSFVTTFCIQGKKCHFLLFTFWEEISISIKSWEWHQASRASERMRRPPKMEPSRRTVHQVSPRDGGGKYKAGFATAQCYARPRCVRERKSKRWLLKDERKFFGRKKGKRDCFGDTLIELTPKGKEEKWFFHSWPQNGLGMLC